MEKPSERIKFALQALEKYEKDKNCRIDMYSFLEITEDEKTCIMCIATAAAFSKYQIFVPDFIKETKRVKRHDIGIEALAEYLKKEYKEVEKYELLQIIEEYEFSIDDAKNGDIGAMFRYMSLDPGEGVKYSREMPEYKDNPKKFKKALNQLANDLEEDGY